MALRLARVGLIDRSHSPRVPLDRLVFSLDLRSGQPIFPEDEARRSWPASEPLELAGSVLALGIRRILLLDLARVGTGRGLGTLPLLSRLRPAYPGVEITLGGGVTGGDEVHALVQAGADAVLIGSALHDGRIGVGDLGNRP